MVQLIIDHIVVDPEHRGGKPRIKGTGIAVQNIVEDLAAGLSLDYITDQFDLTLGQVYAALSYYYDHKDEIDHAISEDRAALQTLVKSDEYRESQERTQQIKARLEAHRGKPTEPR
jgi:uncharacterized protein (DUF433 family)